MKTYYTLLLFIVIAFSPFEGFAQVGIETNNPHKSAVLDIDVTNKGILFPRISLSSTSDTSKIINNQPANTMAVYNTNVGITGIGTGGKGYYYWDTNIWKKIAEITDITNSPTWNITGNGSTTTSNFLGTTDNVDLVLKTNNTEQMRVSATGKVGIGTSNPQYNLQVNGDARTTADLYIGTTDNVEANHILPQLLRDNTTGQVYQSGGNTASISYVKYTISNVKADLISDLNTKVPVSDYTMVMVGNSFSTAAGTLKMSPGYSGSYAPQNVYAFPSGGTWHLAADYVGGTTISGNGTWTFYCLILNNSVVKALTDQTYDLRGNDEGRATAMPEGL